MYCAYRLFHWVVEAFFPKAPDYFKYPFIVPKTVESTPGSYATGGDMDPDQKERTKSWFEECNDIPGTYRFKIPEGGVDFGKAPASTAWHVHLVTDKGNVIVPGTSFLDHDAIRRAKAVYRASKAMDLARLLICKGKRFSPSSNPLGETAAFMKRFDNEAFPPYPYTMTSFRHRKGGRRG